METLSFREFSYRLADSSEQATKRITDIPDTASEQLRIALSIEEVEAFKGSLAMTDPMRFWRVIVSALLIALVLATTMGMVCHSHDQCSAGNCTLCHLQIVSPTAGIGTIGLALVPPEYAVRENRFISRCSASEKPPRAPPV